MTPAQKERLARLVLGACFESERADVWSDIVTGRATPPPCFEPNLSTGEAVLVQVALWVATGQPNSVLVSDLAKLDERCRARVVFALRLMFVGGLHEHVEVSLANEEDRDAAFWKAVAA